MEAYKPNAQEKKVIAIVVTAGEQFKPLHKKLREIFTDEVVKQADKLKSEVFGVSHGNAGRCVNVSADPNVALNFYWTEFCGWCFGVSARRINQLLDTDEAREERKKEYARPRPADSANAPANLNGNPNFSGRELKKYEQDLAELAAHPEWQRQAQKVTDDSELKPLHKERVMHRGNGDFEQVKRDALQMVSFDHKDPYAYFEQFREEPQTMGDEISAMLIEFKLDIHQIREVLRYAEMGAKRTLQQLEVGAAA